MTFFTGRQSSPGLGDCAARRSVVEHGVTHAWDMTCQRFRDYVPTEFLVFDQGTQITAETMKAFVESLKTRPHGMADLILVPKDAPFTQAVASAITA
jgi:hypothetical protein